MLDGIRLSSSFTVLTPSLERPLPWQPWNFLFADNQDFKPNYERNKKATNPTKQISETHGLPVRFSIGHAL
jgi:hypothetical protein